jgi:hypothetical protein
VRRDAADGPVRGMIRDSCGQSAIDAVRCLRAACRDGNGTGPTAAIPLALAAQDARRAAVLGCPSLGGPGSCHDSTHLHGRWTPSWLMMSLIPDQASVLKAPHILRTCGMVATS